MSRWRVGVDSGGTFTDICLFEETEGRVEVWKVAFTPDGFRDLLEIGRQKRPDLYDIFADKPPTLVDRSLRLEVAERVRHTGEIEIALDEDAVRAAARALRAA